MNPRRCTTIVGLLLVSVTLSLTAVARAQAPDTAPADRAEALPPELEGIGIDEKLDTKLPLDLEFTDQDGRPVRLRDYFDGQRPVILTLNYYRCPMLCGLQLNGLVDTLKDLDWTAGDQFKIVTVGFDPLETATLAKLKQRGYIEEYGRPPAAAGWQFLTGHKKNIDPLLDATGFRIRYDEKAGQWLHIAALIICTPDGRISRYLYGVVYEPKTLRLSLVEASEGKIGSTVDRILLYCFHYDPDARGYTLAAFNIVRAGGVLTLLIVGGLLLSLARRYKQRGKAVTPTE